MQSNPTSILGKKLPLVERKECSLQRNPLKPSDVCYTLAWLPVSSLTAPKSADAHTCVYPHVYIFYTDHASMRAVHSRAHVYPYIIYTQTLSSGRLCSLTHIHTHTHTLWVLVARIFQRRSERAFHTYKVTRAARRELLRAGRASERDRRRRTFSLSLSGGAAMRKSTPSVSSISRGLVCFTPRERDREYYVI